MIPIIKTDFYKTEHFRMYANNMSKLFSTFTPRKSRKNGINSITFFGLRYFILKYLIDDFNKNFFNKKKEDVIKYYKRHINTSTEHIEELHDLGYLPISIYALDEGAECPIKIPPFVAINSVDGFGWLVNYLETLTSCCMWQIITSATISREYYRLLNNYALKTDNNNFVRFQFHDFSMRGMSSLESAINSGMGHLVYSLGTDTVPAVYELEEYYGEDDIVGCSVPACYDDKTEVLTNKGWKFFEDLDKSELVAQYTLSKEIEFVKPLEYFKDKYKGKMIKFSKKNGYKYIDSVVTPNHKMVRLKGSDEIDLFEAGDFSYKNRNGYSHRNNIVISGNISIKTKKITNLERLKIAFQADGSFPSHKEDYNGSKGKGFLIRFSLKKERKKERLEYLLKSENLEYTINKYENGYYSFWINVPEPFVKDFSWVKLDEFSYGKCVDFINELKYWDGCSKKNCIIYSSTNIECINIVQAICSISNYKTQFNEYNDKRDDFIRKPLFNLTIQPNKNKISGNNIIREELDYDGYVYCVSVPSKMIVTRRNNTVLICGNTEHSIECSLYDFNKNSDLNYINRILDLYPSGIVSIVLDGFNLWKGIDDLRYLKNKILRRGTYFDNNNEEYISVLDYNEDWSIKHDFFFRCSDGVMFSYEEILENNNIIHTKGKTVIRPDSGNPVDIICGKIILETDDISQNWFKEKFKEGYFYENNSTIVKYKNSYYLTEIIYHDDNELNILFESGKLSKEISFSQAKGVIELLYDIFGGEVNDKGYIVLNQSIGAIYGDSITLEVAKEICERLIFKGFATTNIVFGIGLK